MPYYLQKSPTRNVPNKQLLLCQNQSVSLTGWISTFSKKPLANGKYGKWCAGFPANFLTASGLLHARLQCSPLLPPPSLLCSAAEGHEVGGGLPAVSWGAHWPGGRRLLGSCPSASPSVWGSFVFLEPSQALCFSKVGGIRFSKVQYWGCLWFHILYENKKQILCSFIFFISELRICWFSSFLQWAQTVAHDKLLYAAPYIFMFVLLLLTFLNK